MFLNRHNKGMIKYPGPFLASLRNIWRVRDAYVNGGMRPSYVALHRVYGDVVRLGPKALSFASPAAVDDIYQPEKNMAKGHKKENIFSTRDIHWHTRYRTLVGPGFKIVNLAPKEKEVDELIKKLLRNLNDAARSIDKSSSLIDLPLHLQHFTFDAGGVFAFSQPYGFLDQKTDLDGIIQSVRVGSTHLNRVRITIWDMTVYFSFIAPPMAFAKKYLPAQRIEEQLNNPKAMGQHHDLLDQFLEAHKNSPDIVTRNEVVDLELIVVVPASEAVRTAIAALIYYALKAPVVLTKLRREIDSLGLGFSPCPFMQVPKHAKCRNMYVKLEMDKTELKTHPGYMAISLY
ncbi:benzoate 4-monooxygenase cytochrome P450, putative [Talaromyces stipitatus ATCC 10500]|uniref:Benzoate 4-monooxygenase cytochrome P450, putative n=1 Tax=Talaromyces stipitatus (strain ATCC 10500 / CBS 375.48 / QM 6759 / NRRL 1006) TaxID=441959 RepID=B8MU44_TALSN|nr:benzoate 4-monooxygenase cytochrome P450, putative [Talaromyces stipitatus ATCC 10500]EED12677.1 benzoate 4-monooxygenase cytochrome P450, putative [Talaromyces stipitatus ATCC 10500]